MYSLDLFGSSLHNILLLFLVCSSILLSSLKIIGIITLSSLLWRLIISSLSSCGGRSSCFCFHFKNNLLSSYFANLILSVYVHVSCKFVILSNLREVALWGDILWGSATYFSLFNRSMSSRVAFYVASGLFFCSEASYSGHVIRHNFSLAQLVARLFQVQGLAAGPWWLGQHHIADNFRDSGSSWCW